MSNNEKWLLRINGLFFFTSSLAGIFVSLYLYKLGNFKSVVYFELVNLTTLYVVYFLSGHYLKKISSRVSIRLGFLFYSALYTLLFVLKNESINNLMVLGIIKGLAGGFFWVGNNLTQYVATHTHTRNEYFGKLSFFMNIGSAFGPALGGFIIYLFDRFYFKIAGYSFIFFLVGIFFFLLFLITSKLPEHKITVFSFFDFIKHKRKKAWKTVLGEQSLIGLYDVSFGTFAPILTFIILKQEFHVGIVGTFSTLTFAFANLAAIKLLKKFPKGYLFGGIGVSFGLVVFALQQNWIGILVLLLIVNIFQPLINIPTAKALYDVIDSDKKPYYEKYHFLIERDIILGLSRVVVYAGLFFAFTGNNQVNMAKNWILIISMVPFLISLLQLFYDKQLKI